MPAEPGSGFDLSLFVRRGVVLVFTVIQLILSARILLDLGVVPDGGRLGELITIYSDVLAAPVQEVGSMVGGMLGPLAGSGLNVTMIVALAGWSIVEAIVMRIVRRLDVL